MKTALLLAFSCFVVPVFCQNADSLAMVREVDSLIQVSRALTGKRDFVKALEIGSAAEKLALEKLGRESAAYGRCCFNHGRVLHIKKDYSNVEKWYLDALEIQEKVLGNEHPDYAGSLNNLAVLYVNTGSHAKAEPLYLKALAIREKTIGKEHPDYAGSLVNLAILYQQTGNYAKSEARYLEAKDILAKARGKEHPDYATAVYNLAELYRKTGNHAKAEPLYLEAMAIREKTPGKEHPDYASALNGLANLYQQMGNSEKAETYHLEAKAIKEKILGKEHPDYAITLNNLAILYMDKGDYAKAEPLYLEAMAIRGKALGKTHPEYAASLNNLAILYRNTGRYEKAEALYLEAKALKERTLGKAHPDYAAGLSNLAVLYHTMGHYEKAEGYYLEAKTVMEKTLGKAHPNFAGTLNSLAALYLNMGDFEKAEAFFLEAGAIKEKTLGKAHPDYSKNLEGRALLYMEMGNFEKAEALHLEAKAIRKKALGEIHPDYTKSVGNLANVYLAMGDYGKAEALYLEEIALKKKTMGKEQPDLAIPLNNLAALYQIMGNYEKAEALHLEACAILEKAHGKEHPEYAASLNNLAYLYMETGHYEKAETRFSEVNAIREKILGKEHPHYAESLNNLALLYMKTGNHEKAVTLQTEASAILEKALGKEHPGYAKSLFNLASMHMETGRYEKAETLQTEANAILEKTLGKEHPDYARSLEGLAIMYKEMGNFEKAEASYATSSILYRKQTSKSLHHLSEREMNIYLNKYAAYQDGIFSFAQLLVNAKSRMSQTCFDNTLFFKGFLLNAGNQIKRLVLADSATTAQYELLKSCQRRLAAQYAKPIIERDTAGIKALEGKANDFEKNLARTVAGFGEALKQVKWHEVQQNLKADEAALEFVHYRHTTRNRTDSTLYAALLLLPGAEQPRFIPLFEEKSLDSLLARHTDRNELYVKRLYSLADRGAKPLNKPQKTLYDLLWKPLEKELANVSTIYYSPSGLLHRLNLAAIPIGLDSVLGDRHHLVELGSTRQLVVPNQVKPAANDALLFGGISYDSDSTAMSHANAALDSISIASRGELSFTYTDSTLRVSTWSALPYTDREVGSVEKTLKAAGFQSDTRRGFAATEEAFKTLGAGGKPSPRILHLATHGFFFPDPKSTSARFETSPAFDATEPVFKISDHPMIRSGLLLAGANHAWQTGKPLREGMEDGILTAYEISQMNLSNTELVVLSACETGLGDISGNEGVYGLQRAFKIAGAKYLIMSLWQVPDKQTSLLMTTFYKKWLEDKMAIPEAFRAAQKELQEAGLDPYYWAGFVLVE